MSFLKIIRPFNCLFVAITVLFGAFISNEITKLLPVIFAALSATFIAAAGYVINDFFDLPIDKMNKPHRILPAGMISPQTAYLYAVLLFLIGIVFSFLTQNMICVGLAIFNSLTLFFYAKRFKLSFLTGNLLVSYLAGSTFLYGGLAANNLQNSILIAVYAFLYTLVREFIKDAEDIEGDIQFGARTLAVKLGRKKTSLISLFPTILIILFTFYTFGNGILTFTTFLLMHTLVSLPLIIFFVLLIKKPERKRFAVLSTLMKIDMFILMIILWVG